MPVRMPESHRVRGSRRIRCLITNARHYGQIKCVYCLTTLTVANSPRIDHVNARSQGGSLKHPDNLVVCCHKCNGRKGETDVVAVFGEEIAERVYNHIITRRLTEADWPASIEIHKASGDRITDQIEMTLDWVNLGLLPLA